MHIHKINSTSKEHQNFLTQNRKDPITGDSISAGDEVVFCASCKSVFLKDTWEYLGKQHCHQNNTLIQFPTITKLELSIQEEIFFYCFLPKEIGGVSNLNHPNWIVKKRELSAYHQFFNLYIYYIATLLFLASIFVANYLVMVFGIMSFLIATLLNTLHNKIHRKNITTIYRNFTDKVFFLSTFGIGFSDYCGIKEHKLNFKYIKSLEFEFSTTLLTSECSINYTNGTQSTFRTEHFFETWRTTDFLKAISKFNKLFSIPIYLKVERKYYETAIAFVNSTPNNITIQVK